MGIPFSESENQSAKRLVGIGVVLFLHLVIAYILMTSLATDFIKPVEKPVELQIIQDIEPPPPPPPKPEEKPPEPPKMDTITCCSKSKSSCSSNRCSHTFRSS